MRQASDTVGRYLLPGPQLFSPLLYLLAVLLVQLFQLLGLVFNQEVAFFILEKEMWVKAEGALGVSHLNYPPNF